MCSKMSVLLSSFVAEWTESEPVCAWCESLVSTDVSLDRLVLLLVLVGGSVDSGS